MERRKALVRDAYDAIAGAWSEQRRSRGQDGRERSFFGPFLTRLPAAARVLDLGCGSGVPIMSTLIERGFSVTGVDFSFEQLSRARARFPEADLRLADLAAVDFAPASFQGVVAYDSIWHVPREEHAALLSRLASWLAPDGVALLTLGVTEGTEHELLTQLEGRTHLLQRMAGSDRARAVTQGRARGPEAGRARSAPDRTGDARVGIASVIGQCTFSTVSEANHHLARRERSPRLRGG